MTPSVVQDVGPLRTSAVTGDNAEWKSYYEELVVCCRNEPSYYPATVFYRTYPQDLETYIHTDLDLDVY